jgi:hypothetical protein
MTALLYYSISSGLSEDELVRIDDEVCKNRKAFCIFARNIPSNVKGKTKRIIIVISFATAVLFSNRKSVETMGLNMPPQQTCIIARPDSNRLIRPSNMSINFQKQPKIMMERMSKPGEISFPISIFMIDDQIRRHPGFRIIIHELRGGSLTEASCFIAILGAIVLILAINSQAFVPPDRRAAPPPHLEQIYGNNRPGNDFGYGKGIGPRTITVTGLTQNAGSDKKEPSKGSYDYVEVMKELDRQSSKKNVEIEVGDQLYIIKNRYRQDASELCYYLADQMYDSIRECDTDICDIAKNLGFKADNIKKVKDHVFYQKHELDQYVSLGEPSEYKRFDPYIQQALTWKRLGAGTHTQDDITWIKHECAERHHELKYGSGYSEAHNRAQTRFDGAP